MFLAITPLVVDKQAPNPANEYRPKFPNLGGQRMQARQGWHATEQEEGQFLGKLHPTSSGGVFFFGWFPFGSQHHIPDPVVYTFTYTQLTTIKYTRHKRDAFRTARAWQSRRGQEHLLRRQ
jgi:hypothetical protein